MTKRLMMVAAATFATNLSAFGALSVEESFAYPSGSLSGTGGGTGFAAAWSDGTAVGPGAVTVGEALAGPAGLVAAGGSATLGATKDGGADGRVQVSRALASPLTSNPDGGVTVAPYYLSFVANLDDALFTQVSDAGQRQWGTSLLLRFVDGANQMSFGKGGGSANWNFSSSGFNTGGSASPIGADPTLLVVKFTPGAWNVTEISMWVAPGELGGTEPAADWTGSTNIGFNFAEIQLIAEVSGWLPITSPTLNHAIDEIRVGSTWADVTPVPEPVSVAFAGLAGAALLSRRRRA